MGSSWYWHRVVPLLRAQGHDVVAPDLPATDDSAGLAEYVEVIDAAITRVAPLRDGMPTPAPALRASAGLGIPSLRSAPVGDRNGDLIVVGQSMGGLSAPLLCARRPVALLVLVAPMIPAPGETGGAWWANTGQPEAERALAEQEGRPIGGPFDPEITFLHDVPPEVAAEARQRAGDQSGRPFADPWPLEAWPEVPTRVIACRRDRLFPIDFMRRVSRDRLGIVPDELDSGHLPALSQPEALVDRLERYRTELCTRSEA
jgi:pimeloyl-ACP methyl ester carboxylesterase